MFLHCYDEVVLQMLLLQQHLLRVLQALRLMGTLYHILPRTVILRYPDNLDDSALPPVPDF